jgi:hypothetical protein
MELAQTGLPCPKTPTEIRRALRIEKLADKSLVSIPG